MRFLFVMDPIDNLNFETDTTLEIMREAVQQGIETWWCSDKDLFYDSGLRACAHSVIAQDTSYKPVKNDTIKVDDFDIVLMRLEPPYNINYHNTTLLLEQAKSKVLNSPAGLRHANEKLVILNFPEIIPKTLVTKQSDRIIEFVMEYDRAVIKPIHLFGGKNVLLLEKNDLELHEKIDSIIEKGSEYAIIQEYLKNVVNGDKRILLLDGELLGSFKRVPRKGEFRANMALGGRVEKADVTEDDKLIIDTIRPYLKQNNLAFVGLDVIDGKLIEMNVTCPTGLVALNKLTGANNTNTVVEFLKNESSRDK